MRIRSRTRLVSTAGAAFLALGLLAGCAANSGTSEYSSPAQPGGAADQEAAAPDSVTANTPPMEDRALVTTGYMGISTGDVAAATEQVEGIVDGFAGRIDSRSESTGDSAQTRLTVRVPADDYDALLEALRGAGTVQYVETNVVDVTMQTVDLEARIASLEASVASLRTMLTQATNVSDMLEVETTLSDREAELQSLRAQQTALADQVAMSTLDITISNDELTNPTPDEGGFLNGLQAGWNALMAFFNALLTLLGFILPGLIILLILGAIALLIVRAIIRARDGKPVASAQQPAAMDAAPGAAGPGQAAPHVQAQAPHLTTAGSGPYAPGPAPGTTPTPTPSPQAEQPTSAPQEPAQPTTPPASPGEPDAPGRGDLDGPPTDSGRA